LQDANWNTTAIIAATGVPGVSAGAVINRFAYSPYGEVQTLTASWATPPTGSTPAVPWAHLFQGLEFTDVTGLAYVRHRDYSATLGRFIELDPIGFDAGDNNWYRFVANGPTGKTDPSGLRGGLPWWLPPIVIEQLAEQFIGYEDAVKKAMEGAIRKTTALVLKATIEQHRTGGLSRECDSEHGVFNHPSARTMASGLGFDTTGPEASLKAMKDHPQFSVAYQLRAEIEYWKRQCGDVDYRVRILADITITPRDAKAGPPIKHTDVWFGKFGSYTIGR
jgi:RHS repeat-associated protein